MKSRSKGGRKRAIVGLRKYRGRLPAEVNIVQLVREVRESPRSLPDAAGEPRKEGDIVEALRRSPLVGARTSPRKRPKARTGHRGANVTNRTKRQYVTPRDVLPDIPPPTIARTLRVADVTKRARSKVVRVEATVGNWNHFAAEHDSFIEGLSYSDHMFHDVLSLVMNALAAKRILCNPALIEQARSTLEQWMPKQTPAPRALIEWRHILAGTPQEIAAVAMSLTQEATRLRSSSPLGCLLTQKMRAAAYAIFGKKLKSLADLREDLRAVARAERRASPKPKTAVSDRRAAVAVRRQRRVKARQPESGRRRAPKAQRVEVLSIASKMKAQGLPDHFIVRAVDLSQEFEGILNLMRMWRDEAEPSERVATAVTIQELIDDCTQVEVSKPLIGAEVRAGALGAFVDGWGKEHGPPTSDELDDAARDLSVEDPK